MFNPSGVEKRRQGFDAMLLNSPEAALDRVYVALDLETTGLNADRHKIIEVGAVKFRGPEVIDVFETFVNPYTSIPQFVGRLTGIRQRDVDTAPPFAAVAGRLGDFVGGLPVIGHNVAFDMGFLAKHGLPLNNPTFDTWDLASVLLPRATEYSLSLLAKSLGINHERPHRALDDAQITREVFLTLLERAQEIDRTVSDGIKVISHRANWSFKDLLADPGVFRGVEFAGPIDMRALGKRLTKLVPLPRPDDIEYLDEDAVVDLVSAKGLLSEFFPVFEHRPEQMQMIGAVARTFNNGGHLMVEGGTGVGKTVAYLLPAIKFAMKNGARVVVSTNTSIFRNSCCKRISQCWPTCSGMVQRLTEWSFGR